MSEKDLVSGCQSGDNVCRRYLYDCYAKKMLGLCLRYTGEMTSAEDILHDGFIRIFESIRSFQYRGEGSLKAWMSRIFVNQAIEFLRKGKFTEPLIPEEWKETEDFSEAEIETIPMNILMSFITELPVGYRTVFNLSTFEDMSHKEIANKLNINESSSRSQLSRAKAILAEKVKNYMRTHG
ncbi:RNA polymerase sigma factor [Bacteroidales bacterium OttesenSCG-928-A17]|nr:RNA polymerase sigma factor [Bacteroidales bacterium OttesenSCG-928-A17]